MFHRLSSCSCPMTSCMALKSWYTIPFREQALESGPGTCGLVKLSSPVVPPGTISFLYVAFRDEFLQRKIQGVTQSMGILGFPRV